MKPSIDRAIAIFSSISEQLGPQYLAYWVLPNIVLTLSGARAYCDGVFWDSDNKGLLEQWDKELSASMEVVKKQGDTLWSDTGIEQVLSGGKYANFQLTTKEGLRYVLAHTSIVSTISIDELETQASLPKIIDLVVTNLKSQPEFKQYSEESLHDIAFGILVGYPDKAILEAVLLWNKEDDPFAEPVIDADIRGANYYSCPQPVYSYPRSLVTDPAIANHEKLWSGLLREYYQSDFHKSLEKNSDFQAKLRELGNLR